MKPVTPPSSPAARGLKPVLNTLQLWGIAVGLVISGEYFGWSYGWASAGTLGFTVTALFIAAMYTSFIFSFTELTTSIPHAGGPFAYSKRAFGPLGGYLAGAATRQESTGNWLPAETSLKYGKSVPQLLA
jgi:ethanolamine permease